jgi:phage shock protein C
MSERKDPGGPKRLYRSRMDRKLAGVCGGIGAYFNVDPVLIRLLWVFFTLAGGGGLLAYIIAWLVVPESPEGQ